MNSLAAHRKVRDAIKAGVLTRPNVCSKCLQTPRTALTDEQIYGLFERTGLSKYHVRDSQVSVEYDRLILSFARAVITASEGLGAWQPIATAPRDGTRVLIYMPEASRQKVMEAYWATPWEDAPEDQCWWSTPHGPAGRGYTILPVAVTHWMPMPAPPRHRPRCC